MVEYQRSCSIIYDFVDLKELVKNFACPNWYIVDLCNRLVPGIATQTFFFNYARVNLNIKI